MIKFDDPAISLRRKKERPDRGVESRPNFEYFATTKKGRKAAAAAAAAQPPAPPGAGAQERHCRAPLGAARAPLGVLAAMVREDSAGSRAVGHWLSASRCGCAQAARAANGLCWAVSDNCGVCTRAIVMLDARRLSPYCLHRSSISSICCCHSLDVCALRTNMRAAQGYEREFEIQ